jgi:hypothetical protein
MAESNTSNSYSCEAPEHQTGTFLFKNITFKINYIFTKFVLDSLQRSLHLIKTPKQTVDEKITSLFYKEILLAADNCTVHEQCDNDMLQ